MGMIKSGLKKEKQVIDSCVIHVMSTYIMVVGGCFGIFLSNTLNLQP